MSKKEILKTVIYYLANKFDFDGNVLTERVSKQELEKKKSLLVISKNYRE